MRTSSVRIYESCYSTPRSIYSVFLSLTSQIEYAVNARLPLGSFFNFVLTDCERDGFAGKRYAWRLRYD